MEKINNIMHYSSAWDVFDENTTRAQWEAIPEDVREALHHVDDFEPYSYVLVNTDTVYVVDSINGDVLNTESLKEFMQHTIEYITEGLDYED